MSIAIDKVTLEFTEEIPHHEVASLHRHYTDEEFTALKQGIEEIGQLVPVIMYRGKLVDGRHRQRALIELGIHDMKCSHLPNNLTIDEVKETVLNTENRRTDNVAQKAIRAYNWLIEEQGRTQEDAGTKFAVNRTEVGRAKKLLDEHGKLVYERLLSRGYVLVGNRKQTTLRNILKALSSIEQVQVDREPLTEYSIAGFDILKNARDIGDRVAVAMIANRANNILKDWDE